MLDSVKRGELAATAAELGPLEFIPSTGVIRTRDSQKLVGQVNSGLPVDFRRVGALLAAAGELLQTPTEFEDRLVDMLLPLARPGECATEVLARIVRERALANEMLEDFILKDSARMRETRAVVGDGTTGAHMATAEEAAGES